MKIRSYLAKDYNQLKSLLMQCDLFDKSYDKKSKLGNKKPRGSIIVAEDSDKIIA